MRAREELSGTIKRRIWKKVKRWNEVMVRAVAERKQASWTGVLLPEAACQVFKHAFN